MSDTASLGDLHRRISPVLAPLEAERRLVLRRAFQGAAVLLLIGAVSFLCLESAPEPSAFQSIGEIGALFCLGGGAVGFFWLNGDYRRYRRDFKANLIGPLVRLAGNEMRYSPDDGISESEFRSSRIFSREPDRYAAEDLVRGRHVDTSFEVSEVHAEYKTTTTDSEGRTTTTWHDLFRGVFLVADFNKDFAGSTIVLPDTAERWFGHLGTTLQTLEALFDGRDGRLVRLEDPDFEREFVVMSTDEIEARYVLSTSLMRRILHLRSRVDGLALAFQDSKIYLAISSRRDAFEAPSIFTPLTRSVDLELLGSYLADLQGFVEIIDELGLNTRIWSKRL